MSQFEEMESVLEEERRALASQRLALANERANVKRTLETVRAELAKNGGTAAAATALAQGMGSTQGTKAMAVDSTTAMGDENGPSAAGNFQQIG